MSTQTTQIAVSERVRVPYSVTRGEECKKLIASLYGTPATAFSAASVNAARDAFVAQCLALAMARAVYGDSSRLERLERYAATLPEYRKSKAGVIGGTIGKMITAYREAVNIGAKLGESLSPSDTAIDLSVFTDSPVFSGLIAPAPKKVAVEKPAATAPETAPATATTATAPETAPATATAPVDPAGVYEDGPISKEADSDLIAEISNIETAEAEKAEEEANRRYLARLSAEGEDLRTRIIAFCDLANHLGVKLTPAQMKQLDKLDQASKAA